MPTVRIDLCEIASGEELVSLLKPAEMENVASNKCAIPLHLRAMRSQCVLKITISNIDRQHRVALIRNGSGWPSQRTSNTATAQFLLTDDVEQHSFACVVGGRFAISAQLELLVFRTWSSIGEQSFSAPKWARHQVNEELARYLRAKPKAAKHRSLPDSTLKSFKTGAFKRASLAQALHDATLKLTRFLSTTSRKSFLFSNSEKRSEDIDIEATLESLRQRMTWLSKSTEGPISVSGERFTTLHVEKSLSSTGKLDLSAPLLITRRILFELGESADLGTSKLFLTAAYQQMVRLNDSKTNASSSSLRDWCNEEFTDQKGVLFQSLILRVVRLAKAIGSLDEVSLGGLSGLSPSFRDFDLFEWSVFSAIASAIGAPTDSKSLMQTELHGPVSSAVNVNRAGGSELVRALLPGWRDKTEMPSGYLPDCVVHHNRTLAIPVDAKFRIGTSLAQACSPDSIKEMQAYLNEFGLKGGIIVVPMIADTIVDEGRSRSRTIAGEMHGRSYQIWVIENSPGRDGFTEDFLRAINQIAEL